MTGLTVFKNRSGPQAERIKKDFKNIFRKNSLNTVSKCNQKIIDYTDVTLNLLINTNRPFSKPNNKINYTRNPTTHRL